MLGRSAAVGIAAFLLLASGAAAQSGPLRHVARAPAGVDAVAYAGTERVYASGRSLLRIGADGRPVRVARLRGAATQLAASPDMVALVERRGNARRLLAGPPAGPLRTLARCRGEHREIPYSPLAVAGGAVAEALTCERARGSLAGVASFRVHDAAGVRTVAAPAGERVIALAGAPGTLAAILQAESLQGPVRIEVSDAATGALRYALPGLPEPALGAPLAVQADGLAVFCGADDRLAWASPAEPSAHSAGRVACPFDVALAGGRIAYRDERSETLRVAALDGRARTLIRRAGGVPFAWDGVRLLVRGLGCGADFLGERGVAGAAYRGRACRVRILGVDRGRSPSFARVTIACRPGCRGGVELLLGHAGRYAHAGLRLRHAGQRVVRVRLGARARRLLRRYRDVPFHVSVRYVDPSGGATSMPTVDRAGTLPGDGARAFPPARRASTHR